MLHNRAGRDDWSEELKIWSSLFHILRIDVDNRRPACIAKFASGSCTRVPFARAIGVYLEANRRGIRARRSALCLCMRETVAGSCVELEGTAEREGGGCEDGRAEVPEAAAVGAESTGVDVLLTLLTRSLTWISLYIAFQDQRSKAPFVYM